MSINLTNHLKEQVNNFSLLFSNQIEDNKLNYNLNNNNNNITNEFDSINYYKDIKDPRSSLLISSIYSDFNPELIDESFSNNKMNLINNQTSRIFPNGFFVC